MIRFAYRRLPVSRPVLPLGGISYREKPALSVTVVTPVQRWVHASMVDSGADDTIFPDSVATFLGIDLTNAPQGDALHVGGQSVAYRYARVGLSISDGMERYEWEAIVGFLPAPLRYGLLGLAGFLEFFEVTLSGERKEVVIVPSATFPGIISRLPSGGP